jgi:hypothetical protein
MTVRRVAFEYRSPHRVVDGGCGLWPPRYGCYIEYMTTNTSTDFRIDVRIVDTVDNQGLVCEHCQDEPVMVTLYLPVDSGEAVNGECCTSCMVSVIDATPYLETTHNVVAEVARDATNRPF